MRQLPHRVRVFLYLWRSLNRGGVRLRVRPGPRVPRRIHEWFLLI